MTARDENDPLRFDDPNDLRRFREVLRGASFSDQGVAKAIGLTEARAISARDLSQLLQATQGGTPLETLIRLFLMGMAVEPAAARQAAAPMELAAWVRAGLVVLEDAGVRAAFQLLPYRDLLVAFDLPPRGSAGLRPNYVMGIGSSTLTLANVTVRRPARTTLDLGTGCGLLALLAARHSRRVAAVDLNPRAVRLAAFNAELNELANVECLEGSFFEPVAGRRFDLVFSNPPFVISPESHYIYRDSGQRGDTVTEQIVRRVGGFLEEGGYCQILTNWAHYAGEDWRQRLAGWFEGTGCDAWIMRSDTLDAASYASKWIQHTERDSPEQQAERYRQWLEYYQRERIEAVSGGVITMRRRPGAGAPWFRADDAPPRMLGPVGEIVLRAFELRDFLEAVRDDRLLLAQALRASGDLCLQQRLKFSDGGWTLVEAQIELERGLAYVGKIDAYMAELIGGCDGQRPLGELVAALAQRAGADPAAVTPQCLRLVRGLIEQGFLLPAAFTRQTA